jgi:hypothetical protein
LTHAATAADWHQRFGRAPKKGARPLVILVTRGPVDFVFDILDTEGKNVPVDAFAFPTLGKLSEDRFKRVIESISHDRIEVLRVDQGDGNAGMIEQIERSNAAKGRHRYRLTYNGNHDAPTRFTTVAHELAHLFLGHLGADNGRRVPDCRTTSHDLREVEAEMAAYLVARRNSVTPRSESYLAGYKGAIASLNLYAVARAANAIETTMGISATKLWAEKGQ